MFGSTEKGLDLWGYWRFDPSDLRGSVLSVLTPSIPPPDLQSNPYRGCVSQECDWRVALLSSRQCEVLMTWEWEFTDVFCSIIFLVFVLSDSFQTVIKVICRAGVQTKLKSALKMTKRLHFNKINMHEAWSKNSRQSYMFNSEERAANTSSINGSVP